VSMPHAVLGPRAAGKIARRRAWPALLLLLASALAGAASESDPLLPARLPEGNRYAALAPDPLVEAALAAIAARPAPRWHVVVRRTHPLQTIDGAVLAALDALAGAGEPLDPYFDLWTWQQYWPMGREGDDAALTRAITAWRTDHGYPAEQIIWVEADLGRTDRLAGGAIWRAGRLGADGAFVASPGAEQAVDAFNHTSAVGAAATVLAAAMERPLDDAERKRIASLTGAFNEAHNCLLAYNRQWHERVSEIVSSTRYSFVNTAKRSVESHGLRLPMYGVLCAWPDHLQIDARQGMRLGTLKRMKPGDGHAMAAWALAAPPRGGEDWTASWPETLGALARLPRAHGTYHLLLSLALTPGLDRVPEARLIAGAWRAWAPRAAIVPWAVAEGWGMQMSREMAAASLPDSDAMGMAVRSSERPGGAIAEVRLAALRASVDMARIEHPGTLPASAAGVIAAVIEDAAPQRVAEAYAAQWRFSAGQPLAWIAGAPSLLADRGRAGTPGHHATFAAIQKLADTADLPRSHGGRTAALVGSLVCNRFGEHQPADPQATIDRLCAEILAHGEALGMPRDYHLSPDSWLIAYEPAVRVLSLWTPANGVMEQMIRGMPMPGPGPEAARTPLADPRAAHSVLALFIGRLPAWSSAGRFYLNYLDREVALAYLKERRDMIGKKIVDEQAQEDKKRQEGERKEQDKAKQKHPADPAGAGEAGPGGGTQPPPAEAPGSF
jgi:hypothetical protein